MGLFEDAFEDVGSRKEFGPQEAFVGILLSAVASDGYISDDEAAGLHTITARMKLFERVDGNRYGKMIDRLLGVLKRNGCDELLEQSVEYLPGELSETAFANACDLVLADQGIEEEEKRIPGQTAKSSRSGSGTGSEDLQSDGYQKSWLNTKDHSFAS